jgi:2-keto-4-pentenoate hydratase
VTGVQTCALPIFKKGDLLSLGGFLPPVPSQSGMNIQLQYLGLPGDPAVSVEFN